MISQTAPLDLRLLGIESHGIDAVMFSQIQRPVIMKFLTDEGQGVEMICIFSVLDRFDGSLALIVEDDDIGGHSPIDQGISHDNRFVAPSAHDDGVDLTVFIKEVGGLNSIVEIIIMGAPTGYGGSAQHESHPVVGDLFDVGI